MLDVIWKKECMLKQFAAVNLPVTNMQCLMKLSNSGMCKFPLVLKGTNRITK